MTDKQTLLDMGFSEAKVVKALKVTGGLQPAMDWCLAHVNDPDDEEEQEDSGEITAEQQTAQSLKCDDCATAAENHAIKTTHQNFSESTEGIKPLSPEEKALKLAELKVKMAEKREAKRLAEIQESKTKEVVRRKTGQEMAELKDKFIADELKKAAEEKKREKEDEKRAKERVKAQLEQDKLDRQRLAEERKQRAGAMVIEAPPLVQATISTKNYNQTRLQVRMPAGAPLTCTFEVDDPLENVFVYLQKETGSRDYKLFTTFPRKELNDTKKSLKELALVPSASLVAQPL